MTDNPHAPSDSQSPEPSIDPNLLVDDKRKLPIGLIGCVGIPIFFVLVVICSFLVIQGSGNAKFNSQVAKIKAAGQPTTPTELANFYSAPKGDKDTTQLWIDACAGITNGQFNSDAEDLPFVGNDEAVPTPGRPWAKLSSAHDFIESYQPALDLMHTAAGRGGAARYEVDFSQGYMTILDDQQHLRAGARLLVLEAYVKAHENDPAGSLRAIQTCLLLGKSIEREPILISQLIGMAIRNTALEALIDVVPHLDLTESQLVEIQHNIRDIDYKKSIQVAIMGERVLGIEAFVNPQSAGIDIPFTMTEDKAKFVEYMTSIERIGSLPWPQALAQSKAISSQLRQDSAGTLTRLRYFQTLQIVPAVTNCFEAGARGDANHLAAECIIALLRYKKANGEFPESLNDLIPQFLPRSPMDPFAPASLMMYKNTPERIAVYSVGQNQANDGGDFDPSSWPDFGYEIVPRPK